MTDHHKHYRATSVLQLVATTESGTAKLYALCPAAEKYSSIIVS